jgi:hypothetical protein
LKDKHLNDVTADLSDDPTRACGLDRLLLARTRSLTEELHGRARANLFKARMQTRQRQWREPVADLTVDPERFPTGCEDSKPGELKGKSLQPEGIDPPSAAPFWLRTFWLALHASAMR